MSQPINDKRKTPVWMRLVIAVAMLPLLLYPTLLSIGMPEGIDNTMLWLYPVFVVVGGICAWITYPDRHELAWILVVLMLLCHGAMLWMTTRTTL